MGIAPFGDYLDDRLPTRPLLEIFTKKQWSNGYMRNGVHIPSSAPLEVYLDVFSIKYPSIYCRDCGLQIQYGEVACDASYRGRGWHCINCLTLPQDTIEAWKFTYPMKRKSRKNPSGKKVIYVVNTKEVIAKYIEELNQSFSGYGAEIIWSSATA